MKITFKPEMEMQIIDIPLPELNVNDVVHYRGQKCSKILKITQGMGTIAVEFDRKRCSPLYELIGDMDDCFVSVERTYQSPKRNIYDLKIGDYILFNGKPHLIMNQNPEIICIETARSFIISDILPMSKYFTKLKVEVSHNV